MSRLMFLTLLSLMVLSCRAMADDEAAGPRFAKPIYPDAVDFSSDTSPDGEARTIVFSNFVLETNMGRLTQPDVRVKTFTYVMGVESDTDTCVHQTIQGFLGRFGTSSASLIVHAGGKTTVVDLKQAIADNNKTVVNRDDSRRKQAAAAAEGANQSKPDGESDAYIVSLSTNVPKGQPLQTTIILLVDRVTGGEDPSPSALLTVSTIDCTVEPAKKAGQ